MAFPPYVEVFGGQPVWPSENSYISYDLDTISIPITLQFPQVATTVFVTAGTIQVTTSNVANTITMPDVTIVSPGYTIWIRNIGSVNLNILKNDGTALATIGAGQTWYIQVTDNSTAAGIWYISLIGAGSSSVQPVAIAGPGLTVNPLNSSQLATNVTSRILSANYTLQPSDRAVLLVWMGGTGIITLPPSATTPSLSAGFLCYLTNMNPNAILTITASLGDLINGVDSITCLYGNSFIIELGTVATIGVTGQYYTIGNSIVDLSNSSFPNGTASNPSINFIGDNLSGFSFFPSGVSIPESVNVSIAGNLVAEFQDDYLNLTTADLERDAISYLAIMRTLL